MWIQLDVCEMPRVSKCPLLRNRQVSYKVISNLSVVSFPTIKQTIIVWFLRSRSRYTRWPKLWPLFQTHGSLAIRKSSIIESYTVWFCQLCILPSLHFAQALLRMKGGVLKDQKKERKGKREDKKDFNTLLPNPYSNFTSFFSYLVSREEETNTGHLHATERE